MIIIPPYKQQHAEIYQFIHDTVQENGFNIRINFPGAIFGKNGYSNPLRVIAFVLNNGYHLDHDDFTLTGFLDSDVQYPFSLSLPPGNTWFSSLSVFEPRSYTVCDELYFKKQLSETLWHAIAVNDRLLEDIIPVFPESEIFLENIYSRFLKLTVNQNNIETESDYTPGDESLFLTLCFLLNPFNIPTEQDDKEACMVYFRSVWEGMV